MLRDKRIGFVGGGFMAEALIGGLLKGGASSPETITVSDIRADRLEYLKKTYGVKTTKDNATVAKDSDVVVFAVKPQQLGALLKEISGTADAGQLFVSIAAGVKIASIAEGISGKIVRAMPNTCAQVGEAVTALCHNEAVTEEEIALARELFDAVGTSLLVGEQLMDAVTAVSGSGPAYIFLVMEAMIQAGVQAGLSLAQSRQLVLQTVKGAAELAIKTDEHPATLKERIMSPGGTTVAALRVLEQDGVRGAFLDAVAAAAQRAEELG